jgi:hypothetical protein
MGLVPQGEVGLICVANGQALGIITPQVFAVIVIVVRARSLIRPHCISLPAMQTVVCQCSNAPAGRLYNGMH